MFATGTVLVFKANANVMKIGSMTRKCVNAVRLRMVRFVAVTVYVSYSVVPPGACVK